MVLIFQPHFTNQVRPDLNTSFRLIFPFGNTTCQRVLQHVLSRPSIKQPVDDGLADLFFIIGNLAEVIKNCHKDFKPSKNKWN